MIINGCSLAEALDRGLKIDCGFFSFNSEERIQIDMNPLIFFLPFFPFFFYLKFSYLFYFLTFYPFKKDGFP